LSSARKSPIDCAARAQPRKALRDGVEHALGVGRAVQHAEEVEDFLAFQAGAFDAQLVDGLGQVGEAAEVDADGRAAAGGLRARPRNAGTRPLRRRRPAATKSHT
jgi:hypothetical protein